jgi:hypothetical protein
MGECLLELFVVVLLALVPAICAIFQSFSVAPRRRDNITSLVEATLSRSGENLENVSENEQQRPASRISPARYLVARGGTKRIREDFSSLYGGSFLASALIVTVLYFASFWLGLSLLAQSPATCIFPGKHVVDCIGGVARLRNIVYAALGAYIFNLGVMVRRAFLSDITEHVFWSAINRLLLSASLGLVFAKLFDSPSLFFGIAFVPRVLVSSIKHGVSAVAEKLSKSENQDKT